MTSKTRVVITSVSLLISCAPAWAQVLNKSEGGDAKPSNSGAGQPVEQNTDHPRLGRIRQRMRELGNEAGGPNGGSGINNPGILGAPGAGRAGMDSVPGAGPGGNAGAGQDGNGERRREFRERMLKRFDANGDGVLSDEEKAKMHAFMEERRARRAAREAAGGQGAAAGGSAGSLPKAGAPNTTIPKSHP
jgi:hypothetical protein